MRITRKISVFVILLIVFFINESFGGEAELDEEILSPNEIVEVMNKNQLLKINATAAILYDNTYGKILYEKNIDLKIPNASTTKILTAIVAYENSNMDDIVEISGRAAQIGGSTINLREGNKVKMEDLMKALLMSSANDAAIAIAEHVGGNVENFCDIMNKRAKELGALNTNFVTPHGLDKDNHFTTIEDLLIFTKQFMQIPYLREISNTSEAVIKIDNYSKNLKTTNEMLSIFDEVNGVKTGFTNKAGRCLITSIMSGERELITMVMGCESKKQRTTETIQLILYGYNGFEEIDVFERMQKNFEIRVKKSIKERYEVKISGRKKALIPKGKEDAIKYNYNISCDLIAPLKKNQLIGEIDVLFDEELISRISVTIPYGIERKGIISYFNEIINNHVKYSEMKV